MINTASSRNWA